MTSVEWFFKQLTEVDYGCINKTFLQNDNSLAGHKIRELFEQAKAMEKDQIKDAYQTSHISMMTAEQYFKETFKSK